MEKLVQRLVRDELKYRKKLLVLEYAGGIGNNAEACRDFNIPDSSFYEWKKAYEKEGKAGLRRKKPVAYSHPKKIPIQVAEKILQIRRAYQLGPERILFAF